MKTIFTVLTLFISTFFVNAQWVAKHGLTSSGYQAEFNKWVGKGYKPVLVDGYSDRGSARFTAIFEKLRNQPSWVARHGMTSSGYQAEFNKWVGKGYRPVQVTGYGVGNKPYFTAIFEKENNAPSWVARHGMTAASYQTEFTKWVGKGYKLVDLSTYTVDNKDYYAARWEKVSGSASWVARHGMTSRTYQSEFNKWTAKGYRLTKVTGCSRNGVPIFAAIWEKSGTGRWVARHGMNSQQYQDEFDRMFYQGFRPVWVNGYTVNNKDYYAAIWESKNGFSQTDMNEVDQLVKDFVEKYDVPGLSFAITKDGALKLAKTYGYANKSTGERVAPRHRFRIASVSKPVTSVAIMKLVETGKIKLSDRVFGAGGVLGNTYGTKPYGPNITNITVQNLLEHTAGGWTNDGSDPMFSNPTKNHTQLITWVLDNRPLDNVPGTTYAYSNFGYCLLGRIIERVTGMSYEAYAKNIILQECKVSSMEIGGDKLADRKANEVVYYGGNPYGMKVNRMDSHGGWIASPIALVRFMTHTDQFNTVPDILGNGTLSTMFTPSSANNGYAKGWAVNSSGPNYWHNGSLPGTGALLVRTASGYNWAITVNIRAGGDFFSDLDKLMWQIKSKINNWPAFDLFPNDGYSRPIATNVVKRGRSKELILGTQAISVFPNPLTEQSQFVLQGVNSNEAIQLNIYNLGDGRLVYSEKHNADELNIILQKQFAGWSSGLFLIRGESKNGVFDQKVVKP